MKPLTCDLCGSNDIIKQNGLFVCQYCGTKYSVEEARKMMGIVQIDRTEELKNIVINADRAYQDKRYTEALQLYLDAAKIEPNNSHVQFFKALSSAMLGSMNDYRFSEVENQILRAVSLLSTEREEDSTYYSTCDNFIIEYNRVMLFTLNLYANNYIELKRARKKFISHVLIELAPLSANDCAHTSLKFVRAIFEKEELLEAAPSELLKHAVILLQNCIEPVKKLRLDDKTIYPILPEINKEIERLNNKII